jgi:hypothetical protein
MNNVIDGRVTVKHPEGIGYNDQEASRQMQDAFSKLYGSDFRTSIFEYDERFTGNLILKEKIMRNNKPYTIVTVDNGWGLSEFMRIASKIEGARLIVMRKGVMESVPVPGVEFIPYDETLEVFGREADVAFFPRVGVANKDDYLKILKMGIPVVVRDSCSFNAIEHMKTGWLFRDDSWAGHWLSELKKRSNKDACGVTVITPTYHRDLKVINRCISCMLLQTVTKWEQIICSDGELEPEVKSLVESIGDPRIRYTHTNGKKEGDFGNTVRAECLKEATGNYVLFLDDDNLILPQYLNNMISALVKSDADYAVCKIMHFGPLNEVEVGKAPKVLSGDPVKLYHIDPLQFLVKRDIMKKIGWDTSVGYLSDGVSLERLNPYKLVRVDEILGIHV